MDAISPFPSPSRRAALLAALLAGEAVMLAELAQVVGITPPERLAREPLAVFGRVAAFVDGIDAEAASIDGRTWLLNRLGLYLARWFTARHGGALVLQCDPRRRFYLQFVLAGMEPPATPDALLAPFAIAQDALGARPRIGLAALLGAAEAALTGSAC